MSDDVDNESVGPILSPRPSHVPVDRASESVVSPLDEQGRPLSIPPPIGPVSSGQIEIAPESLSVPPPATPSILPPSEIVPNVLERGRPGMPLSKIVAISCGVIFVLIALSLLLFR